MLFGKKSNNLPKGAGNASGGSSFDKIWKKAHNYKADTMLALDAYCSANPAPWYAYFLLAAAYDCNACGLPFDMEKAERYYSLAEEDVSIESSSAAHNFFNIFMEYRNYEPGNLLVDLTPLTRQIRRTGLAAVATNIGPIYQHYNQTVEEGNTFETRKEAMFQAKYYNKEVIYSSPINWYSFFKTIPYQYKTFGKNATEDIELEHTIQPLIKYFLSYTSTINTFKDDVKNLKQTIKDLNFWTETMNDWPNDKMVDKLGETVYDDFKYLILGKALELAKACPFDYVQLATMNPPYYPYRTAWHLLHLAIRLGSVAAAADLSVFLSTEYWSNQFSEFIKGEERDPGLTDYQKLGRELLRWLGTPVIYASYTGKLHAFADRRDAINFCWQYFAPFADEETITRIMVESGWHTIYRDEKIRSGAEQEDHLE